MQTTFGSRLRLLIDQEGLSQRAWALSVGLTPQMVSRYLSDDATPGIDVVTLIVDNKPDLSLEWLLRGRGSMRLSGSAPDQPQDETAPLGERQDEIQSRSQDLPDHPFIPEPEGDQEYVEHPLADGYVAASTSGGGVQHETEEKLRVPIIFHRSITGGRVVPEARGWWTRVRGTSMEPWLRDGSHIFVEAVSHAAIPGRYVIHLDDDDAELVKRIETLSGGAMLLISDNPAHPTRRLRRLTDVDDPDLYADETYGGTVRLTIRGLVLFPDDTAQSIVSLIAQTMRGDRHAGGLP